MIDNLPRWWLRMLAAGVAIAAVSSMAKLLFGL
jgi:hypothetical protein